MVVPTSETENSAVTNLASEYYEMCQAELWNEKTTWIGIERPSEVWIVRLEI